MIIPDTTPEALRVLAERFNRWLAQHEQVKDSTMVRWCPLFKDLDEGEPNVGDIRKAAAALLACAEERERLIEDAERYRWLRSNSLKMGPDIVVNYFIGHDWTRVTELDELDSVIDAAREREEKE